MSAMKKPDNPAVIENRKKHQKAAILKRRAAYIKATLEFRQGIPKRNGLLYAGKNHAWRKGWVGP